MLQSLLIANRSEIACRSILPKRSLGRGTVRRTVEGHAGFGGIYDVRHGPLEIAEHVPGRHPKRRHAMIGQKRIARVVELGLVAPTMRLAIDLDAQPGFGAVEIEHERTRGMLAAKFKSGWSGAELLPKNHLGQRHDAPELARASHRHSRLVQHRACPSTMLRMVPLPQRSLGRV